MLAKRALVVDDSKSARAFLAKLLEEQQVEVDAAETAEQALDYLTHNRPDVIFMDHLMPGMDGFQAVQAIKGNPRTASIPILMYTSQEGELYLGQARALGAEGVLSKSMAPRDVRSLLQQLQLVQPDPAVVSESAAAPESEELPAAEIVAAAVTELPVPFTLAAGPTPAELLKNEVVALRQHLTDTLDAHSQRVLREVRNVMGEAMPRPPVAPPTEPDSPRQSPWAWLLALAASVAAAVLGTLWWSGQQQTEALRTELMDSKSTVALLTARLVPAPAVVEPVTVMGQPADAVLVLQVPFGEQPLAGQRISALREFAARIAALEQKGTIEVHPYSGRFCLSGGGEAGYSLAAGALSATDCDLVAEASDPALGKTGPESTDFTNALAELRKQYSSLFNIDVGAGKGDVPANPYPEVDAAASHVPTAGEWNAVAGSNNRVEIRWHPAT